MKVEGSERNALNSILSNSPSCGTCFLATFTLVSSYFSTLSTFFPLTGQILN